MAERDEGSSHARASASAEKLVLADGRTIEVRPLGPDDKRELGAAMERLSPEARYLRFASPKDRLSPSELAYLTEIDHHRHEALVAIDPATRAGIAVARYALGRAEDPAADVAVVVADDWQRRGIATGLFELLAARARAEGIERFRATLLGENRRALRLAGRLGFTTVSIDRGTVELELELTAPG